MLTPSLLDELNPQQREAVETAEGPVLVLAGAGSGKTRVITYRVSHLVTERGVPPSAILAVTFTNKAAAEMRNRVNALLAGGARPAISPPWIATFHSICVRMLRRDIDKAFPEFSRDFTIYDDDDQLRAVKQCINDLHLENRLSQPRQVLSAISSAKNRGLRPQSMTGDGRWRAGSNREEIARVFEVYETRLRESNALDFDDLLLKTTEMLRAVPEIREHYNERFHYVLVDEYQDTNGPQFHLVRLLTERRKNLCVVGDDDQSIYRWRGADISNILNFEQHYPSARVIRLEQNYRSTQSILDLAGVVIRRNQSRKGKELWTANGKGSKVRLYMAASGDDEARFVAEMIRRHLNEDAGAHFAVLYRANSQSRLFEEALRNSGLAYNIVGGYSFYERAEIRDIAAYLRVMLNPHDSMALVRIINAPARGIGKTTLDRMISLAHLRSCSLWEALIEISRSTELATRSQAALAAFLDLIERCREKTGNLTLPELVKYVLTETRYVQALQEERSADAEGRLLNLEELVSAAAEAHARGQSLREFLDATSLRSDTDDLRDESKVTLLTMHSAKGLEFPVVFIAGLEEGLFPHSRSLDDLELLEEERRLCYVAVTRAQKQVYLTLARRRRLYGEEAEAQPSQFLADIPAEMLEDLTEEMGWRSYSATASNGDAARPLSSRKNTSNVSSQTFNSVESVRAYLNKKKSSDPPRASGTFRPGAHVRHPKYGLGVVVRSEGQGSQSKVVVHFPGFGQKTLVEEFSGLQRVH